MTCLDELLAVLLHLIHIDVPPEGGVPVAEAVLHQVNGVPQTLQHDNLPMQASSNNKEST